MSGFKFKDATIKRMKLAELKPAEYNPRRISDKAMSGLGESIQRFGLLAYIVWNKRTGNIVGGHQRYKTLMDEGQEETDVVVVDLDGNEEVILNVVLNSKELRGDFTKEVVRQLNLCEARMGNAFEDVGLKDLLERVGSMKFEDKSENKNDGSNDGSNDSSGLGDGPSSSEIPTGPEAVITCPNCQSSWRMRDNKVLVNTFLQGEEEDA